MAMCFHHPTLIVVLGAAGLFSPSALAQPADSDRVAAAQQLYEEAKLDMDRKIYILACPKLEQVTAMLPEALGAKMTLGECYEAQGKLASAIIQYRMVEEPARKQGQLERAMRATDRVLALQPQLATLSVEVSAHIAKIPGFSLKRDRAGLTPVQWGMALPIDRGKHSLVASAPGYKNWVREIEIQANGTDISVKIDHMEADVQDQTQPVESVGQERTWQRPLGIGISVIGGLGLGAGTVMGALSMSRRDASNNGHCNASTDLCHPEGMRLREEALHYGTLSTAFFIAGGIGAGIGLALLLMPSKTKGPVPGVENIELRVTAGGLVMNGGF